MKNYRLKLLLAIILGALFLMFDAFYNGYPLFTSDSNTYINSGFTLEFPGDRPIAYGLFIRLFSFNGLTLWTVIFFQSLMLSYVLFLFIKLVLGEKRFITYSLLIIFLLSLLTCLSWVASQIMADVFTPIALFALFIILFGRYDTKNAILLYLIYAVSVSVHLSHILLFSSLLLTILLARKWLMPIIERKKFNIGVLLMLGITLLAEVPMRHALEVSKYVFFMGSMCEKEVTQPYLHEYCGHKNYKLCVYKDSIAPDCCTFVWNGDSPFYRIGGWSPEVRDEFKDIIFDALIKPKYLRIFALGSLKETLLQFKDFEIGDGASPFLEGNPLVYPAIKQHYTKELGTFLNSRQNRSKLGWGELHPYNMLLYKVVIISALLIILFVIFYRKIFDKILAAATFVLLLAVIISDWDVATFSTVAHRFGCKVIWLIPLLSFIFLIKLLALLRQKTY